MLSNFKMQKCLHLKDELAKKNPKLQGDFIITEKYEGWYTTVYYDGEKFHNPVSSAGREIPAFSWVANLLNTPKLGHNKPFMLIAEAYLEDTPFETLNGIFNRSKGDCLCREVIFKVHDAVPLDIAVPAVNRMLFLRQIIAILNNSSTQYVAPLYTGEYSESIWNHYFEFITSNGGEGIVAKRASAFYQQGKRNSDLLKLKLECTVDALAIQLLEDIGEKGNPSLTLVSQRKNGIVIKTVISKHSDQKLFREDAGNVLGKVVQIKAMEEYSNGQLRQPVFQYIRHDKQPEDIN